MKTLIKNLTVDFKDLQTATLHIDVDKSVLGEIPSTDKPITLEIAVQKRKRSLNANAYMWVLLDKIARLIGGGITKDDLYRKYIREAGVFDTSIWVLPERYEAFKKAWESKSEGNMCEILRRKSGMMNLICYYGSHYYSVEEMSFLIEKIIADAEDMGISTITPKEYAKMMRGWKQHD